MADPTVKLVLTAELVAIAANGKRTSCAKTSMTIDRGTEHNVRVLTDFKDVVDAKVEIAHG